MKRSKALPRPQNGLSLIELMVALVIGLVLMIGVLQVFLASRQTYATNEAMSRLQENGRFALDYISNSARHAGYTNPRTRLEKGISIDSLAGSTCNNQSGFVDTDIKACSSDGGGKNPDSIGFALQPPEVDGEPRDCLGNKVASDQLIINHFEVIAAQPATNTPASLGCRVWNLTTKDWANGDPNVYPLIEGIDSLQVLYGLDDAGGTTRSPSRYVSADNVTNWKNVLAVRISVLANSVSTLTPSPPNRNYVLLDTSPLNTADLGNDNRARQIFSTTIQLKNTN